MNVQWYLTLVHRLCPPIFVMFPSYFTPSEINRFRSDLQVNLPLCDSSCIVIISPLFKPSTASVNDHHILEESPFGSQIPPCFSLCFFQRISHHIFCCFMRSRVLSWGLVTGPRHSRFALFTLLSICTSLRFVSV